MEILDEITTDKGTFRVSLEQDDDPLHPREDYDQAATMVLAHRRYNLPHEGDTDRIDDAFDRGGYRLAARYLTATKQAAAVLPVWGYDHGQLTLKAGERDYPFDDRWDSGLAGLIYITPEAAREAFGENYTAEQLDSLLTAEVAEYDQYLTGDVWGYVIEKLIPECEHCGCEQRCEHCGWELEDSCWGFYGYDYAEKEARSVLSALAGAA